MLSQGALSQARGKKQDSFVCSLFFCLLTILLFALYISCFRKLLGALDAQYLHDRDAIAQRLHSALAEEPEEVSRRRAERLAKTKAERRARLRRELVDEQRPPAVRRAMEAAAAAEEKRAASRSPHGPGSRWDVL